jgi:hypothetical protein
METPVIPMNPALMGKALKRVLDWLRLQVVTTPVGSEEFLYRMIQQNWFNVHKQNRGELNKDEKRMARETFSEVPESLQANYFSNKVLPPEEDLKKMFYDWAWTGLKFDSSASDDMVEARNINAFLKKRCGVRVNEYREDLIWLSNLWKEACRTADENLRKTRRNMGPNKRRRLDHVPFEKPTIEIKPGFVPFVDIPQPPDQKFSIDYYHEMLEVLNTMNKNFPNKRNNSIHNDKLRPARSHLRWTYMVSALIAYHLANDLGNKPLSKTFVNYGKSKKWKYKTNDQELREKMTNTFHYHFFYGTTGIFDSEDAIKDKEEHFAKCKGIGGYMYGWMQKLKTEGNYYVTDEDCTKHPSRAVLTEHYLFLEACGMWDHDNSESNSEENSMGDQA